MSTEINTSHDFVKDRTEKTHAVQVILAADAAWTWPLKTLAQWEADVTSLDATVNDSLAKVTAALNANQLTARDLLQARCDAIHAATLLTVGIMRVRAATLPGLLAIVNDLSARGDSRRAVEDEADELLAAWEEWEEQTGALFTPAPGRTLAAFKLLLEGGAGDDQATNPKLGTLKKTYRVALGKWRRSAGLLNVLYARLEDECVAWYAEATKVFLEGTAEGNLIRELIPTNYNPPTPAAPAPANPPPA